MPTDRVTMVVGGAGFIGSHLVDRLLAEGIPTDVVDDLSSGSLANLADARRAGGALKIHTLKADAAEFDSLVALRRPDVIYHLALLSSAQGESADAVSTTLSVLHAAHAFGVSKVVVALPAGELYGDVPARDLPVKESRTFAPTTVRGVLARTVIELLAMFRDQYSLEHTALAMALVYGPRQRPADGVVAAFVAAATDPNQELVVHGDGRQSRDLLFIDDAVDALLRAGQRGGGLVINVGSGIATSVRDLAAIVAPNQVFEAAPRPRGDLDRMALSAVRARIQLAWEPWTDIAEGVRATVAAAASAR